MSIPPLSSFINVKCSEMPKHIGEIPVSFDLLTSTTAPNIYIYATVGPNDCITCLQEYHGGFLADEYPHPHDKDDILRDYEEYACAVTNAYTRLRERRELGIRDTGVIESSMYRRYYGNIEATAATAVTAATAATAVTAESTTSASGVLYID